jgi:hypothetical protein
MRETRTSGLMSGDGKRATASRSRTAPVLDSTEGFTSGSLLSLRIESAEPIDRNGVSSSNCVYTELSFGERYMISFKDSC